MLPRWYSNSIQKDPVFYVFLLFKLTSKKQTNKQTNEKLLQHMSKVTSLTSATKTVASIWSPQAQGTQDVFWKPQRYRQLLPRQRLAVFSVLYSN